MRLYLVECSLCVLFSSTVRVRIRIRFSVWLVSCYAHVFVIVTRGEGGRRGLSFLRGHRVFAFRAID